MDDGVRDLVARWQQGDQQAAGELFRRYAGRLVALARSRLSEKFTNRVDPEDIVQSVYRSFFADTRAGRFELSRGGDLWQLLLTMTLHKLQDQVKRHTRGKRAVEREHSFGSEDSLLGLQAQVCGREPTPLEAVALAEELEQFMRQLPLLDRRILELRLQGYNLEEIAEQTQRGLRTVCRVLERIKQQLAQGQHFDDASP